MPAISLRSSNSAPAPVAWANGAPQRTRSETVRDVLRRFRVLLGQVRRQSAVAEKSCRISSAQLWALWELGRTPGSRLVDLARMMVVKVSAARVIVERLQTLGLVRIMAPADQPGDARLTITAAGQTLLDRACVPPQGILIAALERLDEDALRDLNAARAPLIEVMAQSEGSDAMVPLTDMVRGTHPAKHL